MNFSYRKLFTLLSLFTMLFVQSCKDEEPAPVKPGADGFFIVNEGGFPNENTSISFYDRETDAVTNDVFYAVNETPLGIQAQSMEVFEGKGYIMVQGSAKIEVINTDDYTSVATITEGIESPRYFTAISSTKAYVSDWGADGVTGTVKVLDLTTHSVTKTISLGQGANHMLRKGNFVYVTNSGGWGYDNTVKVINTDTDEVTATITVGDNPNSIQQDAAGNIWVATSGAVAYNEDWSIDEESSTVGSISKISADNTEIFRLDVTGVSYGGPSNLSVSPDGKTLYYTFKDAVYSLSTSATALPTSPIVEKSYYGFAVNPFNGNLLGGVAPNFSSSGSVEVLDEDGNLLDTYTVGIAPNGFAFK